MAQLLLVFTTAVILGSIIGLEECELITKTASSPASHYGTQHRSTGMGQSGNSGIPQVQPAQRTGGP